MAKKKKPKPLPSTLTGKGAGKTKVKPPKGGGFLGNRPNLGPGVNAPEVLRGTNQGGAQFVDAQGDAQVPLFRQLADQQFNQIGRIAGQLNNPYTRDARNQVNQSFTTANQLGTIGNRTMAMGDAAGQQITNLAPLAQQQANQAAGGITRLGNQAVNVGDRAGEQVGRLAPGALAVGNRFMGELSGVGNTLTDQAEQGFATAGPTSIEQALYDQGQAELAMGRSLSPEQLRDATQSARQGFAARGMATGNAALGAELLNRDRFASQREAERRAFAAQSNNLREENVMARRDAAGRLATSGANAFSAAGQMGLAGRELAGNLYDTAGRLRMDGRELGGRLLDAGGRLRLFGTQTAGDLRATGADTSMRGRQIGGTLLNQMGLMRQDGARTLADLDPYQRAIQGGLSLGQTAQAGSLDTTQGGFNNALDLFANTGSFNVNRGDSLYNSWLNNATAVRTGNQAAAAQNNAAQITAAATRAARPKWYETALGAVGNIFSDERMKTDVKPIGTAGNVLGLTAYEFRYKGDKKKHKGFMAQDVQKVLPEAVEEVDYKGKKRLTIKPMVIGAALAEELMSAKAA
jgi:hypothetical protein